MRFRVLGPLEVLDRRGRSVALQSPMRRRLLAALVVDAPHAVSTHRLAEILWGDAQPADPAAALQSHVYRLRHDLGDDAIVRTTPTGYLLDVGDRDVDSHQFDVLLASVLDVDAAAALTILDEALALWRGPAFAGFEDDDVVRAEATRLTDARLDARERRAAALLGLGRDAEAVRELEHLFAEAPLREHVCALLMRSLYRAGRHVEALAHYQRYRRHLGEELGLEPGRELRELERAILTHRPDLTKPHVHRVPLIEGSASGSYSLTVDTSFIHLEDLGRMAWARAGARGGQPLVVVPAWVSSIEVIASGRDPRSGLVSKLSEHRPVILYDRLGTGLSDGPLSDASPDAAAAQLVGLLEHLALGPLPLLAVSQAGPVAVTAAAQRPDLVSRLVFFGTYASGPRAFPNRDASRALVALVRAHWGMASKTLADLFLPESTREERDQLAADQRRAASADTAARLLQSTYEVDVTDLLPRVSAPALVMHYLEDRAVPAAGAHQLVDGLSDARYVPLSGTAHLPMPADLDQVAATIGTFVDGADGRATTRPSCASER